MQRPLNSIQKTEGLVETQITKLITKSNEFTYILAHLHNTVKACVIIIITRKIVVLKYKYTFVGIEHLKTQFI